MPGAALFTAASVNTIGHAAGVLIFGTFLYLVLRRRSTVNQASRLPLAAAILALLWNLASLVALILQTGGSDTWPERYLAAAGFSVLSLLPAVLLHLSLEGRFPWLIRGGYALSSFAVVVHAIELVSDAEDFHRLGVWVITVGF